MEMGQIENSNTNNTFD